MSSYDHYSATYLIELYFSIKRNIESGFLSKAMYHEMDLIAQSVKRQGVILLIKYHATDQNQVYSHK
ncbi:hypothetical protein [Sporolactobacillus terrae]|uniref:Uncharacterized protein n=1 Tax=Sporolactobacillus terrae TaxID=269673 RepID=A0A410DB14_9BACL|nr:hypothetical protein [Sporolactobacillus terrae]QAA23274.1 hypothetical protein C0674_12040 [Sporolactobacillus terrae]QAA26246.1 hypothetical protein C0679_12025 [Sporolactobacillus terrae]UAK15342.1 hypothetical protein K7399_09680 [Sporolactobacillus terrae]BBN99680.1 hypothetical protein St703_23850 [Sporolactobacillus terrae]